ncbi:MAG: hypothetical protein JWM14_3281 [Chitinophagaceae bacterium]|nr:hypothetical protein [Chitinophagaceae bacterium]
MKKYCLAVFYKYLIFGNKKEEQKNTQAGYDLILFIHTS